MSLYGRTQGTLREFRYMRERKSLVWCFISFFFSLEYEGDSGVCKLVFVTFDV